MNNSIKTKVRKSTRTLYANMTENERDEYRAKTKKGVVYWKEAAEFAFKDAMAKAEHGSNMNGPIGHECKRNLWSCIEYYQSNYTIMKELDALDKMKAERN